jgi:hypothetical protein
MSERKPHLSPRGEQQRRKILELALNEARGRRRRRVLRRVAVAGLFAAILLPPLLRLRPSPPPPVAVGPVDPIPTQLPALAVTRIATDPHIIERLSIPPSPLSVTLLNDRELLTELATANRPAGLAYVNGKAMLLYR